MIITKKPIIEVKETVKGLGRYQKDAPLSKLFICSKSYLFRVDKQALQ